MTTDNVKLGIIGAGKFGTALAHRFCDNENLEVSLGVRRETMLYSKTSLIDAMLETRTNPKHMPGKKLSDRLRIAPVEEVAIDKDILIISVPVGYIRDAVKSFKDIVSPETIVLSTMKGIEFESFKRPTEILDEEMDRLDQDRFAVLSGPTFSYELYNGNRLSAVIAARDNNVAAFLKSNLAVQDMLSLQTTSDVRGVEYAGALKNVIAIGAGFLFTKNYGHGPLWAYLNNAAFEMKKMIYLLGGNHDTIHAQSGIADLFMTSTSRLSRNWNAGKCLAETGSISYNNQDGVAEGVYTSKALREFFETNDLVEFASEHFKILLDLGYMIHGNDRTPEEIIEGILSYYETENKFNLFQKAVDRLKLSQVKRKILKRYEGS
ncbi:MAG: NAD(P)-binding domain-containing protein [Proteobacteria bacterium]|nr:NAD(P)-binding domain-containing protein [Pseudomonadota bacterium]